MDFCFLIPNYNHNAVIEILINELSQYGFPIVLIDDGSDQPIAQYFDELSTKTLLLTVLHHTTNQGKGAAMQTGFQYAADQQYKYAIQIDADGQHAVADIKKLIAMSKETPNALISGNPIYDQSVPKHRYLARYITHIWVYIETLSLHIIDSMCGFRVYPIKECMILMKQVKLGQRMDFDTDIMVRLYWQGVDIQFLPTKVIYPKNSLSHFHAFKDNLLISWLHTRLFFGMLWRSPKLLWRKFSKNKVHYEPKI